MDGDIEWWWHDAPDDASLKEKAGANEGLAASGFTWLNSLQEASLKDDYLDETNELAENDEFEDAKLSYQGLDVRGPPRLHPMRISCPGQLLLSKTLR